MVITGTAPSGASTCLENEASVDGDTPDPNESNNSAESETCTPPLSNLTLDKTSSKQRVTVGDPLVYTMEVHNEGPDPASNPRVTDTVPGHLDARVARTSKGDCSLDGNRLACTMGEMAVGETATIRVRAIAIRAGGSTNAAEVADERCESDPCDSASVGVRIVKPRLRVAKRVKPRRLRAGGKAVYAIRVRNPSRRFVRSVRVCDRLPSGLVLMRSKPRARVAKGMHCWRFKRIGAGKARVIRVVVRALRGTRGRKINRVAAASPDAKPARARTRLRVIGRRVSARAGGVTG